MSDTKLYTTPALPGFQIWLSAAARRPLSWLRQSKEFQAYLAANGEPMDSLAHYVFIMVMPLIVRVEAPPELPIHARQIATWHNEVRTGSIAEDWQAFRQQLSDESVVLLWAAYKATTPEIELAKAIRATWQ